MSPEPITDGIHAMAPRDQMAPGARHLRDTYAITPGLPLIRREFGFYSLDAWREQGMPQDVPLHELFDYGPGGAHGLGQLGWCEAAFAPCFETLVVQDRGEHEVVQDYAGRHVLYFKGRRDGFMPEYLDHPVKNMRTWVEDVKWRLDPTSPERFADLDARMAAARDAAGQGYMIQQNLIGGYMYLRSLIGPEKTLYAFHDMPELVHDCMQTWLTLADAVIARHQEHVTLDELFLAEDICYNHGPLISPAMMREFLFPYYQQLIANIRSRQLDPARHLYIQIDTDGFSVPVIPVYGEIGMDVMSPFEVASGCDVVQIARQFPGLVILGGIDKRVLARGREAIDEMLEYVIPPLRARGGYVPTCDHGVPAEVPYEDYVYYRERVGELGG
jgi:uroporphyrinogen decarboxylase